MECFKYFIGIRFFNEMGKGRGMRSVYWLQTKTLLDQAVDRLPGALFWTQPVFCLPCPILASVLPSQVSANPQP